MVTLRDIQNSIEIEDMAYRITLACCRTLTSQTMHEKIVEAIVKAVNENERVHN